MSATGHQRRRREAAANEVVDMLNGGQLAEFVKATELACEPTKDAVRAAVANQGDYTAMLEAARAVKGLTDKVSTEPAATPLEPETAPVDEAPITSNDAFDIIDAALAEAEAVLGKSADDASAAPPTPKPKRKPAKRKPRAKKGSSK